MAKAPAEHGPDDSCEQDEHPFKRLTFDELRVLTDSSSFVEEWGWHFGCDECFGRLTKALEADVPESLASEAAARSFETMKRVFRNRSFLLGRVVATRGAIAELTNDDIKVALGRHAVGDWGNLLDEDDRQANEQALQDGARLLSAYRSSAGVKFWIITESDRSVTTVLLPEEY